ncbi:MAG: Bax inhibitor-1/YccA family protein [Desulfovibrionaceae bacterium]|nr:Bax inhibitor-1/YccA family protein [Desulfovibrionaceae bacterium]
MSMPTRFSTNVSTVSAMSVYMSKVYFWMTIGLSITAITAFIVSHTSLVTSIITSPVLLIALLVGEVGLVIAISAAIHKMSAQTATLLFALYSFLNGLTLASIFLVYTLGSITNAFVATAGTFLAMSVYGTVTKRDLTSLGSFLFMGLIGLIIAMLVNVFLQSPAMDFVISGIGVLIFTLLTAYDTQKLRQFGEGAPTDDGQALQRGVVLGALTLYLDFINLFLFLLRFLGVNRD